GLAASLGFAAYLGLAIDLGLTADLELASCLRLVADLRLAACLKLVADLGLSACLSIGSTHADIRQKWKSLHLVTSVSLRMKKNLYGRRRQSLASSTAAEAGDPATQVAVEEDGAKADAVYETNKITDARRKSLAGKFQMTVKLVIMCMKSAGTHILQTMAFDDASAFLCLLNDYEHDDAGPLFDPKKFKANKQLRLTEDMKSVLCKASYERTQSELDCVSMS
ncbi:hypothetical protein LSAT2_025724, partial [Lamellibrachia satsuma]